MPIKPENRGRYPADWKKIRAQILERAHHRCEQCGVPNHAYRNNVTGEVTDDPWVTENWICVDEDSVARIVLTIAHLNHQPEDCRPENLKALCQRCHLRLDGNLHAQHAAQTRRAGKAIGDLFGVPAPSGGEKL